MVDGRPFDTKHIRRELLDTRKVTIGVTIPRHMIENMTAYESKCEISQNILVRFETYIAEQSHTETKVVESRRVPADWFEHLKERWFPLFLLTRYPVKYKVIDTKIETKTTNMYPHITVPHTIPRHIEVQILDRLDTPNWR
jgi:hypothetical protein